MGLVKMNAVAEESGGPNLTSLLDMLFLLIIFFIVSSVFVEEEKDMEVQLPSSSQAEALAAPQPLIVNIRQDGTIVLHSEVMTPETLETALRTAYDQQAGRTVIVRADGQLVTRDCVRVMDVVKKVGFVKFTLKCRE